MPKRDFQLTKQHLLNMFLGKFCSQATGINAIMLMV